MALEFGWADRWRWAWATTAASRCSLGWVPASQWASERPLHARIRRLMHGPIGHRVGVLCRWRPRQRSANRRARTGWVEDANIVTVAHRIHRHPIRRKQKDAIAGVPESAADAALQADEMARESKIVGGEAGRSGCHDQVLARREHKVRDGVFRGVVAQLPPGQVDRRGGQIEYFHPLVVAVGSGLRRVVEHFAQQQFRVCGG